MKHARQHQGHEAKMDLTPMIDLVFLLVMFFVLTSAFTTLNLEDVVLPVALEAADMGEESVLIVNITKTDDLTRDGQIIFDGHHLDPAGLRDALRHEADVDGVRNGTEPSPVSGGKPLSKLEVLIRPDAGVRGEYLRQVFMACQRNGIYRVKLSALQP